MTPRTMTPRKTLILAASLTSAIALAVPAQALDLNLNIGADGDGGNIGIGLGAESGEGADLNIGIGPDDGLTLDGNVEGENGNAGFNIGGNIDGEGGNADVTIGGNIGGEGTDIFGDADADTRVDLVIGLIAETMWDAETELRDAATFVSAQAHSVADWLTAESEARFQAAVEEAREFIANLRNAIEANSSLSAWFESENVDVDTVVALGVTADGQLVAFTE